MAHDPSTRRALLHVSALAGTAALVNACSASAPSSTLAVDASTGTSGDAGPTDAAGPADAAGDAGNPLAADAATLNNLLAAEYLTMKAYEAVIPLLANPPVGDPTTAFGPVLSVIATNWQNHHREHAAQVRTAITSLGAVPVNEASIAFTPPLGFAPTVRNAMVLLCNTEKAAAVAYNAAVGAMTAASARYLATIIEGNETQHFIVLYGLLKQVIAPNPAMLITMTGEVVPRPFINNVGSMTNGLPSIRDFTYTS